MKPVDINPNEEWINMAMAGISPQIRILFIDVLLVEFSSCNYGFSIENCPAVSQI
jgi:hypothetical protein